MPFRSYRVVVAGDGRAVRGRAGIRLDQKAVSSAYSGGGLIEGRTVILLLRGTKARIDVHCSKAVEVYNQAAHRRPLKALLRELSAEDVFLEVRGGYENSRTVIQLMDLNRKKNGYEEAPSLMLVSRWKLNGDSCKNGSVLFFEGSVAVISVDNG